MFVIPNKGKVSKYEADKKYYSESHIFTFEPN